MQTEVKERKLEEMISAIQEEESKLDERWKSLNNIENMSKDFDNLKEKYTILQKNYAFQQQELSKLKNTTYEKPLQLSEEHLNRIENIKRKEDELLELENQLKREREEIDITTALIKQLNEDLEKQKISQMLEQQKLNELAQEIRLKENDSVRINISNLDIDKSFKNSSLESVQPIMVSDMSPFEDKDFFSLGNPFSQDS